MTITAASPPHQLSRNALRVLERRYLRRDAAGKLIETPEQMLQRVARAVSQGELSFGTAADADRAEEEFRALLSSLEFLPNSPALMNAGSLDGQLSACFVLPLDDDIESIFDTLRTAALIQQSGGGTGFSLSKLPAGDPGPLDFVRIFDASTEALRQSGRRRGANMAVLDVSHPDIHDFVRAKISGAALRNFNLSVGINDGFMQSVRSESRGPAVGLFDSIVDAAWTCGDPGLLFVDAIERANPTPRAGRLESTNPCGEVPLLPYEACNLGSIDLARFVVHENGSAAIDWDRLRHAVITAVRFLDDVIEVNHYPHPAIARASRANRKIGLGVMGLAQMLIRLGIPYASEDAIRLASRVARFIRRNAEFASQQLAAARGAFPNWRGSIYEPYGVLMRNATTTAIAPTGTLSIIAGTTSGIEPLFACSYRRRGVLENETLSEVEPSVAETLERLGRSDLLEEATSTGLLKSNRVPEPLRELFRTATEIPLEFHLLMQHAFQQHVDNSVSKTINLPADASRSDIAAGIWRAWELGLKGVTFFPLREPPRSGHRAGNRRAAAL
jgi:ribonucleoside-diphosphate reductase alpha chain